MAVQLVNYTTTRQELMTISLHDRYTAPHHRVPVRAGRGVAIPSPIHFVNCRVPTTHCTINTQIHGQPGGLDLHTHYSYKASIALASTPSPTHHYGRDVYHPNAITEAMSQLQSESSSCLCLNLYPVQIYGTEIPKTQNLKLPCRYQCTRSGDESKFDRHLTCHLPTHTPRFSLHHYAYDLLDACEISIDVL